MSNSGGAQTNFGSCWGGVFSASQPSTAVSGFLAVAQMILRRWSTPRGRLIDDANFGYDLTALLSAPVTPASLSKAASNAAAEAQKDERVVKAQVTITLNAAGWLMVSGSILTANGPFQLVASVTPGLITLLQPSN